MAEVFTQALGGDDGAQWVNPYAAQIAAMQGRLNAPAPPMYTPEEIAQRKADNARQFQLGMLGQLSGDEGLANVGGSVFKQALAQRQPTVTERGVADPLTGQFHYSPDYLREKDEGALDKLQQLAAASQGQWQERRTAAAERAATARQAAADRAALHASIAGAAAGARSDAADARAEQARFRNEDTLRTDYEKLTKDPRAELAQVGSVKAVLNAYQGRPMDAIAQQSLVILLNKFLDPGSVVREGEFQRVVDAQGLVQKAKNIIPRLTQGSIITPEVMQQIGTLANVYEAAANAKVKRYSDQYAGLAGQRGLSVDAIITDPAFRPVSKAAPSGGGGGLTPAEQAELAALRSRFPKR